MGKKQRETVRAIKNRAQRGRPVAPGSMSTDRYWQGRLVGAGGKAERAAWSAYFLSSNEPGAQEYRAYQRRAARVKPGSDRHRTR